MSLPGVCPECSAKFPLHLALQDARARQALLAALKVQPALAGDLLAYMDLFSPAKKAIRMDKLARLLDELAVPMRAGEITFDRKTLPAPTDYWRAAFAVVIAKNDKGELELPLTTHNFLFKVITGLANKAGAQQEQQKETALRQGTQSTQAKAPIVEPSGQELFDRQMKQFGIKTGGRNDNSNK